jgi:FkbM family methyltransferase
MADDSGISKELLIFGKHEPLVTSLVEGAVVRGMTCIDVGSNLGYYVVLEAELVGDEGEVIAFEPSKRAFEYLTKSIAINRLSKIRACNMAVGDSDGVLYFEPSRKSNLSRVSDGAQVVGWETVSSTKIDSLVSQWNIQRIHFMRMDIEGYEFKAIQGARETLQRWKPALLIEIHSALMGEKMTVELLEVLRSLGYDVISLVPRGWDYPMLSQQKRVVHPSIGDVINQVRGGKMPSKSKTFTIYLKSSDTGSQFESEIRIGES